MRIQIEGLKELLDSLQPLTPMEIHKGLTLSSKVVLKSHKIGFSKRITPDGHSWKKNPKWYADMKGNKKTLEGPLKRKVVGGKYKDYSFSKIHYKRMKDLLESKITKNNELSIFYKRSAKERAVLNQYGGESNIMLTSKTGEKILSVNVTERPHLGISDTYIKHGGKTDPDHIRDIFASIVEKKLRRKK